MGAGKLNAAQALDSFDLPIDGVVMKDKGFLKVDSSNHRHWSFPQREGLSGTRFNLSRLGKTPTKGQLYLYGAEIKPQQVYETDQLP